MLTLALRSALDLLDRVAVGANHYFGFGCPAKKVDFLTLWREQRRPQPLRSAVRAEIEAGNWSVLALVELADDIKDGGWLADRRALRNVATHRYLAIHDLTVGRHRCCEEIVHVELNHAQSIALSAFSLARAGLIYLIDAVSRREQRNHEHRSEAYVSIRLPSHQDIRGS